MFPIIFTSILFFFKYFNFAWDSLARLLSLAGVLPRRAGFDVILPVGEKGLNHLLHEGGYSLLEKEDIPLRLSSTHKEVQESGEKLKKLFEEGRFRSIRILYTRYVNSLRFEPSESVLLPIGLDYPKSPEEDYCPPLFEPSPKELIPLLMGQYLSGVLGGLLDESQLSEQASRRNAMDSANDNAIDQNCV